VKKLNRASPHLAGPKYVSIKFYQLVFNRLGLRPKIIYDWHPDFGGKMLLAAILGANYHANCAWVDKAKQNNITDLIGIDIDSGVPKKPDLIIADNWYRPFKYKKIKCPMLVCSPKPIGESVEVSAFPHSLDPLYYCLLTP
jgi:hypothetical protein